MSILFFSKCISIYFYTTYIYYLSCQLSLRFGVKNHDEYGNLLYTHAVLSVSEYPGLEDLDRVAP